VRPLLVLALACALLALTAAPASAGHTSKRCGVVASGSGDYRVTARKVGCRFGRRWTRAYLGRRSTPSGWRCYRPGGEIASYCTKGSRAFWAARL
jgi:hypothetical protein